FLARHLRPRSVVERLPRRLDGALRVFAPRLGHVGDLLAGRGSERRKGLTRCRGGPFAVDEKLGIGHSGPPLSCAKNAREATTTGFEVASAAGTTPASRLTLPRFLRP